MNPNIKLVSDEFKVACLVYEITVIKNESASFEKLMNGLKQYMITSKVAHYLMFLSSWGIVEKHYGETKPGWAGRLYTISSDDMEEIKKVYEKYWKTTIKGE